MNTSQTIAEFQRRKEIAKEAVDKARPSFTTQVSNLQEKNTRQLLVEQLQETLFPWMAPIGRLFRKFSGKKKGNGIMHVTEHKANEPATYDSLVGQENDANKNQLGERWPSLSPQQRKFMTQVVDPTARLLKPIAVTVGIGILRRKFRILRLLL